jgi:hypothetical protein
MRRLIFGRCTFPAAQSMDLRRRVARGALGLFCILSGFASSWMIATARGQSAQSPEWTTDSFNAQRDGWQRNETTISPANATPTWASNRARQRRISVDAWKSGTRVTVVSMLDWDANVNMEFAKSNKTKPRPAKALAEWRARVPRTLDHL